jgi:hypothetical protein
LDIIFTTDPETPTLSIHREEKPVEEPAPEHPADAPAVQTLTAEPESSAIAPCPKCSARLINPESLGWCPKCGYCRSLEEDAKNSPLSLQLQGKSISKPSPLGALEFWEMVVGLPIWLKILVAGIAIVAVVALGLNFALPSESFSRAICSTLIIVIALGCLIAAQVWSVILIAPDEERVGPKDMFFPGKIWGFVFRRLPAMQKQLWMGTWSVTALICAICIIGGLDFWYQYYKPKKYANRVLINAAAGLAKGKDKSLEESIEDIANSQDPTKKKEEKVDPKDPQVDKRPTTQCVILGYILEDGQINGLVLGVLDGEKIKYGGIVKKGFTPETNKELLEKLKSITQPDPAIKKLQVTAVWVRPELFCDVHHSGFNEEGKLEEPNFSSLLKR